MVNERKQSQLYELSNPSILLTNEIYSINLDETTTYGKYVPFNFALLQNNSSEKVRLIINDTIRKIVPAGTIQTFDASTIPAIWSIRVQNLGSNSIAVGEL